MVRYFIHNGKVFSNESLVFSPDNRSYRYGDGLFETIRVRNRIAPLWDRHMNRLFLSLDTLQFTLPSYFSADTLHDHVERLLQKNNLFDARIRISFYRGNGGLTDPLPQQCGYLIQAWPIREEALEFNENGLHVGTYPDAQKTTDFLSNLKSNHYLPYVMASLYAKQHKWNDAFVLNHHQRIADSTIFNVFWVKNGHLFTIPLSEGPVDGVMRNYILAHHTVKEKSVTTNELLEADEIFLTNAVKGIQWVGQVDDKKLSAPAVTSKLYRDIIKPLFG